MARPVLEAMIEKVTDVQLISPHHDLSAVAAVGYYCVWINES
jgi:hypothetical protein